MGCYTFFNHARHVWQHCHYTFMLDLPCVAIPLTTLTGLTVPSPVPTWLADLPIAQEHDPSLGALFVCAHRGGSFLSIQTNATGDLLLHGGKPVIPKALQDAVIKEMHDNRGHFGQARTL